MGQKQPSILIAGGGIAGLSAALRLAKAFQGLSPNERPLVEVWERKRALGGRAGSFRDSTSGENVDYCQHVSMGCCTWFAHFCRQAGIDDQFSTLKRLNFFRPDGQPFDFRSGWLPPPMHLLGTLLKFGDLNWGDRFSIARAAWSLMRSRFDHDLPFVQWLKQHRQRPQLIEQFWDTFLVSALGERVDRVSLFAARKVMVDGFLKSRTGYHVLVPRAPLSHLFDLQVCQRLEELGVVIRRDQVLAAVNRNGEGSLRCMGGDLSRDFSHVMAAMPPHAMDKVEWSMPEIRSFVGRLQERIQYSPISGIHLWFDRPVTDLDHAVFVGRTAHWFFNGTLLTEVQPQSAGRFYCQVVISSDVTQDEPRSRLIEKVQEDLRLCFPAASAAKLIDHRWVEDKRAVFSYRAGLDQIRPNPRTEKHGIYLAGDWVRTGWPATMESAVRGGYQAADGVLRELGGPVPREPEEQPQGWMSRLLIRS